jgi:topoisomerase-4 subunit B
VLSAKVLDPQFQGQIKERLNSRDAVRLVSSFVRPALELWLNQHVDYGKKLAELAIKAAQSRQKAGQKVEKRKGSGVAVLPGKLTDCESKELTHNEVFLVEGRLGRRQRQDGPRQGMPGHPAAARQGAQHLGGRARPPVRQHRDPRHRGGDRRRPARARTTRRPVRPALRQDLHPVGCRRGRLAHPGAAAHAVLPALPEADRFRQRVRGAARRCSASTRRRAARSRPASCMRLDEGELTAILDKLRKEGVGEGKWTISRFKGLGEMSAEQLWETTLNPDTRRLLPVSLARFDFSGTETLITKLMGKGEAAARRELMELHGDAVEIDI